MALAEAARFATLGEAEVACSALRAAGVRGVVFDRLFGGNVWTEQFALGGFRVMASTSQLSDARMLLAEMRVADPAALEWRRHSRALTGAPVALFAAFLGIWGWAFVPLRERFTIVRLIVAALPVTPFALALLASLLWPPAY